MSWKTAGFCLLGLVFSGTALAEPGKPKSPEEWTSTNDHLRAEAHSVSLVAKRAASEEPIELFISPFPRKPWLYTVHFGQVGHMLQFYVVGERSVYWDDVSRNFFTETSDGIDLIPMKRSYTLTVWRHARAQ